MNTGNLILVSAALLYQMHQNKPGMKTAIISGIILTPVISGYEAGIFSYISLVVMMTYLKHRYDSQSWFKEGLNYSWPLFVALILRITIGYALIKFYGLEYQNNGATSILWLQDVKLALVYLTGGNFIKFIQRSLVYFPVTVFIFTAAVFFLYSITISILRKTFRPVLLGLIVFVSLFLLPIVQGAVLQYRTAQSIQLFIPFTGYILVNEFSGKKNLMKLVLALLMFLCLRQGIYLNQVLALNNLRSENEIAAVHYTGMRLYKDYDINKTVVFVCESYDLGEWINEQVSANLFDFSGWFASGKPAVKREKFIDTNIYQFLPWASAAFFSQKQIGFIFSYCGYDLNVLDEIDEDQRNKYYEVVEAHNMKPYEIRDMGEYILVNLTKI